MNASTTTPPIVTNVVLPYVLLQAPEGYRYVARIGRTSPKTKIASPSVMVLVASLALPTVTTEIASFDQALRESFESAQDQMVKEGIEAGKQSFDPAELELEAVCQWLTTKAASNRLTKAAIAEWVDANLILVLLEANPAIAAAPEAKQTAIIGAVSTKLQSLASVGGTLIPADAIKLLRYVNATPDSAIKSALVYKLNAMSVESDTLDNLA